jgi:hypothetical protein
MKTVSQEEYLLQMFDSWNERVNAQELKVNTKKYANAQLEYWVAVIRTCQIIYGNTLQGIMIVIVTGRTLTRDMFIK